MRRFLSIGAVVFLGLAAGCSGGPAGDDDDDDVSSAFPGSRMVWIGDSFNVSANEGIRRGVETRAKDAGALAEDDEYRAHYQPGAQVANGQIPGQYATAVAAGSDIDTVVMDGGGNDIGISHPECLTSPPPDDAACVAVWDEILSTLEALWSDMEADGVAHVIFYGYPELGITGGPENVNYSTPRIQTACAAFTAPLECRFVDPRAVFEGQPYLEPDGMHPTAAGADALAELLWDEMVAGGIAQASP